MGLGAAGTGTRQAQGAGGTLEGGRRLEWAKRRGRPEWQGWADVWDGDAGAGVTCGLRLSLGHRPIAVLRVCMFERVLDSGRGRFVDRSGEQSISVCLCATPHHADSARAVLSPATCPAERAAALCHASGPCCPN